MAWRATFPILLQATNSMSSQYKAQLVFKLFFCLRDVEIYRLDIVKA